MIKQEKALALTSNQVTGNLAMCACMHECMQQDEDWEYCSLKKPGHSVFTSNTVSSCIQVSLFHFN